MNVVTSWLADSRAERPPVVVIAPAVPLSGTVEDEFGRSLPGVELTLTLPQRFLARFGATERHASVIQPRTRSRADGAFDLGSVGSVPGAMLVAEREGFVTASLAFEPGLERMSVVMRRPATAQLVTGTVVDPDGNTVAGAHVSCGGAATVSRDDGTFELDVRPDHADARHWNAQRNAQPTLRALQPGNLPGEFTPELADDGSALWPSSVVLRLGSAPLTLHGRVLDSQGEPVAGAIVSLEQANWFSGHHGGQAIESVLSQTQSRWPHVDADADGRFRIVGLLPRKYRLSAAHPQTLQEVVSDEVLAGTATPIELVLPHDGCWRSVDGRVVDVDGVPVPNVELSLTLCGSDLMDGDRYVRTTAQRGRSTTTGADGRFHWTEVPKTGCRLRVGGSTVLSRQLRDGFGDRARERLQNVEIVVDRRAELQIVLSDPEEADHYRILDTDGKPRVAPTPLVDGRSDVWAWPVGAWTVALYRAEEEVRRESLVLPAGELTVIR